MSSCVPAASVNTINMQLAMISSRNNIRPMNFPTTMWISETGALINSVRVWLRRSSAIKRMVNIGISIIKISAMMPNNGAATANVAPGALASCANCDCTCKKTSRRAKKNQAKINCKAPRISQVEGMENRLRNSLYAMVRIIIFHLG